MCDFKNLAAYKCDGVFITVICHANFSGAYDKALFKQMELINCCFHVSSRPLTKCASC